MHPAVRLLATLCLLLCAGLAQAQLTNGRYGAAQVFDVQRSPALPVAFSPFTVSSFALPVESLGPLTSYSIGAGEYIRFVEVSSDPCRYSLNLYNGSDNLLRTIHASGSIYGLGQLGFLHVSDPQDIGTFVANSAGYAIGDSLSYFPTTGAATCIETASYPANPTPIETETPKFTVGGTVSDLAGTGLVLRLNGITTLPISSNGGFAFPAIPDGSSYSVDVFAEPSGQSCLVVNPSGTLGGANVTNIQVNCRFTVSFTVSGLQADALVEVRDGASLLSNYPNGSYFIVKNEGEAYDINAPIDPPGHVCEVSGPATGSIAGQGVSGIAVTCDPIEYSISGTLSGLFNGAPGGGNAVTLRMDYQPAVDPCAASGALACKVTAAGSEDLAVDADGSFTFNTALNTGDTFSVDIAPAGQPDAPVQTCAVSNAITKTGAGGTVGTADINYLRVDCAAPTLYSVGGTVSGLLPGFSLTLTQSGAGAQIVGNGGYSFSVADGLPYSIAISAQPEGHSCSVAAGVSSGTVNGANVTGIDVACTPLAYSVGGSISGLANGNSVTLRNDFAPADPCDFKAAASDKLCKVSAPGQEDKTFSADGPFSFDTPLNIGDSYSVDVAPSGQPTSPNQTCTVSQIAGKVANGVVGADNVTIIQVSCATQTYSVGGSVSGLAAGNSVVLQINGGETASVGANQPFTFPSALADGSSYSVTVLTQPTTPNQTCVLSRQTINKGDGALTGVISGFNVADILVSCTTSTYTIGGTVSGLSGSGLVLRNNGGDDLAIAGDGPFTFATALPDGSNYNVSIATQPSNPAQTCSVPQASKGIILGAGQVNGANVTGIPVTCVTDPGPPGPPSNVQVVIAGVTATVSWLPPTDDGGSPITGYTVVLQPGGLGCTVSGDPPPTSCQISGVQPGVTYTATVNASNGVGSGAPGIGSGGAAVGPTSIPVDQPWALALLGLLILLLGGRGMLVRRD